MGWDTIVVGAGLLGAVVARRLAAADRRVLVVERGRTDTDPAGTHVRNGPALRDRPDDLFPAIDQWCDYLDVDAPPPGLPGAFTTTIAGGMGVLWTNNCPRAVAGVDRPDLLDDREWESDDTSAEQALDVRAHQFDHSGRAGLVTDGLGGLLAAQGRHLAQLPLAGVGRGPTHVHYVGPADVLADIPARVDTPTGTAERLDRSGGRVRGVVVDGVVHQADHVVVAAGAIETPLLLWRSGLDLPALGTHLSYHPVLMGQVVLDDAPATEPGAPDPLPRLGIPPTPGRPWFVMLLRDTNPFPIAADDLDVPPDRLIEVQVFAPVDPHPDNPMEMTASGRPAFDVPCATTTKRDDARSSATRTNCAGASAATDEAVPRSGPRWGLPT